MKLLPCVHTFFNRYLTSIKGVSPHTIKTYRDVFSVFLPYVARYHGVQTGSLKLAYISRELILAFLNHLEVERKNTTKTRNQRLAVLKSFAKMIRLLYPEHTDTAQTILNIPQKRTQKKLIGYMAHDEIMKVLDGVDIRKNEGFRDFTILHLLFDSGARASEISTLNLDFLDLQKNTLSLLGKGNRYRQIEIWPRTAHLLKLYISKYRRTPKPLFAHRLFISQRGEELSRHGIHSMCKIYLAKSLSQKRLKQLNPVHSFRHSCAINMLASNFSITDIKNHLGHENLQATMVYLNLNLSHKRELQKKFIQYTQSILTNDSKIEELIDWEHKQDILTWLDSL